IFRQSRNTPRTKLTHMSVFWEMPCAEMACCSFAKTRWLRGRSSTPFSGTQQPCNNTSPARGGHGRRIAWLSMWEVGAIPKNTNRAQSILRPPRKTTGVNPSRERLNVSFRAEGFNIFNHTQWSGLNTGVGADNFMRATSTPVARVLQFGLNLSF